MKGEPVLKTAKELKKYVFSRLMCCFGELCTVFFMSVGGFSIFILAFMTAAYLLKNSEGSSFSPAALFLVAVAAFILLLVAAMPFSYGTSWYRIQQIRGNSVHARSIFSCYTSLRKLWQVLRLNSILIIKKLYITVPSAGIAALGFYIAGLVEARTNVKAAYYAVFFLAVLITICSLCLNFVFNAKYAAVPYLYALEPDRPSSELINESKDLMKGKTRYLVEIMLSAAGWLIPCIIIFPMIFVVPYIQLIYTAAVNEIILSEKEEGETGGTVNSGKQFMPEGTS